MNHGRSAPLKLEIMASASASVYPSSYINRNYLIKVNGLSPSGDKLNVLVGVSGAIALIGEELFYKFVGVSGAIALIGEELFYKFVGRAERDINNDVTHCKLRRGIKFSFYRK